MQGKIVIIFERSYFYESNLKQFGITDMREQGYDVELWSLAEWTFHWKESRINETKNVLNDSIIIKNADSFCQQVDRLKNEKVIFLMYPYHAYNMISVYIRKIIKKNKFCFINLTESPNIESGRKLPITNGISFYFLWVIQVMKFCVKVMLYCLRYIVKRNKQKKIKKELKQYITIHTAPFKYKSVCNVITTKMAYYTFPMYLERNSKRNIIANASDYSVYIENKNQEKCLKGKYIVFIDQGLTQYLVLPGQSNIIRNEKKYWEEIERFLNVMEETYQCKVVIAVHPKANYINGEYGGRQLVSGKTLNLIQNAVCVICMFSTSINYIVLCKKTFIQIFSDELMNGGFSDIYANIYKQFEKQFGHKILNISKYNYQISNYLYHYNKKSYDNYTEKYLVDRKGMKDKTLVHLLMEKIQMIFTDYEFYSSR